MINKTMDHLEKVQQAVAICYTTEGQEVWWNHHAKQDVAEQTRLENIVLRSAELNEINTVSGLPALFKEIRRLETEGHQWGEVVMADSIELPFGLQLRIYWQICDAHLTNSEHDSECEKLGPGLRVERRKMPLFRNVPTACPAKSARTAPWRVFNLR